VAKRRISPPSFSERTNVLDHERNRKMSQSSQRYVRGNTNQFYELLADPSAPGVPDGPSIWICGDCHVGNLGPVADAGGRIRIQVRDLDHTVIGNPAHDLIRLALSLASSARGSDLPGVTSARVLEAMVDGYESAFEHDFDETRDNPDPPDVVRVAMREARSRTWKKLAKERLEDTRPTIPLGERFWPVTEAERKAVESACSDQAIARIVTMMEDRRDDAKVAIIDSAYWMKGCSSLGLLRYAVLGEITQKHSKTPDNFLLDVKEAIASAAPSAEGVEMPEDNARRVVQGALHVSPFLGERMTATEVLDRPVVIRELLPQDLKLELAQLTSDEAIMAAAYLATVVGFSHARQMDPSTRNSWKKALKDNRSKDLDAPSWLWTNVVGLLAHHERTYLEHCRRFARVERDR
jgi:uncharacterized protein (DUF2252 family)